MDELVKLVQQRTGLPEDKARLAVDTVVNYLEGRMPGPLAGQVEAALWAAATLGMSPKGSAWREEDSSLQRAFVRRGYPFGLEGVPSVYWASRGGWQPDYGRRGKY